MSVDADFERLYRIFDAKIFPLVRNLCGEIHVGYFRLLLNVDWNAGKIACHAPTYIRPMEIHYFVGPEIVNLNCEQNQSE